MNPVLASLAAALLMAFLAFCIATILEDACEECGERPTTLYNARVSMGTAFADVCYDGTTEAVRVYGEAFVDKHICYACAYRYAVTGRLGAIAPDTEALPEVSR